MDLIIPVAKQVTVEYSPNSDCNHFRVMGIGREFLVSVRIMIHTLVDHMASCFPDPWKQEPSKVEIGQKQATIADLVDLTNELEYLFEHAQKLTKQIARSHELLRTGNCLA